MKLIATIADTKQMPWNEKYIRPEIETVEAATTFMTRMINGYNATLRPNEDPRHLVSVTLEPITTKDAEDMGDWDYARGKDETDNPFAPGELADAWQQGYRDAEDFDTDYDDGDDDSDDENEE